jgi:hypothetical protein
MAGQGPVPKDPAARVRRNAAPGLTRLPADGRKGAVPKWPLIDDVRLKAQLTMGRAAIKRLLGEIDGCTDARTRGRLNRELGRAQTQVAELAERVKYQRRLEMALWRDLWSTPQASQWELLGWTRDVATYVRHKILGELGDRDDAKEARQWSDRLGLNPASMLRLRWTIGPAEAEQPIESPATAGGTVTSIDSRRARLTG